MVIPQILVLNPAFREFENFHAADFERFSKESNVCYEFYRLQLLSTQSLISANTNLVQCHMLRTRYVSFFACEQSNELERHT